MIKVAIIEDEIHTAKDLAETLKRIDSDIEIVSILSNVKQGIEYLKQSPELDLLFSDIQLPDGLSFDIFNVIPPQMPVIFCTAYDEYALEAFQTNGIAYLLKPFSKATLSKALEKFSLLKGNVQPTFDFNALIRQLASKDQSHSTSILVNQGEKIIPVELSKIAFFYIEGDYTYAQTFELKKHMVDKTLEELEELCGFSFFRANRQYLVNRKAVKDASRYLNRKLLANLTINHPERIIVGKLKTSFFLDWLSKY